MGVWVSRIYARCCFCRYFVVWACLRNSKKINESRCEGMNDVDATFGYAYACVFVYITISLNSMHAVYAVLLPPLKTTSRVVNKKFTHSFFVHCTPPHTLTLYTKFNTALLFPLSSLLTIRATARRQQLERSVSSSVRPPIETSFCHYTTLHACRHPYRYLCIHKTTCWSAFDRPFFGPVPLKIPPKLWPWKLFT